MVQLIFVLIASIFTEMVTANPLMQSIQSCPVTNYQQNIYRQPYSEPIILQPSNIFPYPQQVLIQNPLPAYQPLQVPSLKDQIGQLYWEKLLSSPTFRSILDPNNVINNPNVNEISSNCQNRVVNNYIILPPEYIKVNETVQSKRDTQVSGNLKDFIKEHNPTKPKTKKVLNRNDRKKEVKSNTPKPRNLKQNSDTKINTNLGNIMCYTPADVLDDRNKVRKHEKKDLIDKKNTKTNDQKKNKIATATPMNKIKKTKEKQRKKPRKSINNEVKKIPTKTEPSNGKKKLLENVSTKVTTQRKSKPSKSISNDSCCKKQNNELIGEHIAQIKPQNKQMCYEDVNDIFNLKQDCIDLENRRTRSSKTNAAAKESCKMNLDLSDDISRSFAMYINDLYLNPQVTNSNLFSGSNIFPYDFSQIYQTPKTSNIDMKANANKGKTKSSRRKKKSKKRNSTKKKKEEKITTTEDIIKKEKNSTGTEPELIFKTAIEVSTPVSPETNNSKLVQKIVLGVENINIETEKPQNELTSKNPKSEENNTTEVYETQIPETVKLSNTTEGSESVQYEKMQYYETPVAYITNSYNSNDIPEMSAEDEDFNVFDNRLLEDYYPDFTKDKFTYLVSREELDVVNTHNRYFYTTDKNIDSKENSPIYTSREKIIYDEDSWNNVLENNEKNRVKESESEEIVFRTPPALDFPDFTTRKINRDKLDTNELYNHHTSVNDFNRFTFDNFADHSHYSVKTGEKYINPNDNKSGSVVETVFARSKVVKYGIGQNSESPMKTIANDHRIQNDGDKILVIAKTLESEDIW